MDGVFTYKHVGSTENTMPLFSKAVAGSVKH